MSSLGIGEDPMKARFVCPTCLSCPPLLSPSTHSLSQVEKIVTDRAGASEEKVANPPKVSPDLSLPKRYTTQDPVQQIIYQDQHGHRVAHNPSTLEKTG